MRKLLFGLLIILFGLSLPVSCLAQVKERPDSPPETAASDEDHMLLPRTAVWPIYFVWLKQNVNTRRAQHAVEIASQIWNRAANKLLFMNQDTRGGRPALAFVFTYESVVLKKKDPSNDPSKTVGLATLGCPAADCRLMLFMELKDLDMIKCAVHELGHLIGLEHSDSKEDIMYPSLGETWQPSVHDVQRALELVRAN